MRLKIPTRSSENIRQFKRDIHLKTFEIYLSPRKYIFFFFSLKNNCMTIQYNRLITGVTNKHPKN